MRAVIIIALIVLVLVAIGWISFNRSPDSANIQIETQKMKEDTQKAVNEGKEFFHRAEERTKDAADDLRNENTTAPQSR